MKPGVLPTPVKKTTTRKITKTMTEGDEGPFDLGPVMMGKTPTAALKHTDGAPLVVVPLIMTSNP